MAAPLFGPPSKKDDIILKPSYVCTSGSDILIAVVTAVLALDALLLAK